MKCPFGSDEYIEEIVGNYSDSLIKAAFFITGNISDAEDCAQETFIKLMERPEGFQEEEHQRAWLLRVVINKAKDARRCSHRRKTEELRDYIPDGKSTATDFETKELAYGLLCRVNERDRTILYLYYIEGYKVEEIAKIINISKNAAGVALKRARDKLKSIAEGGFLLE